jgi:2-C-methyl-D-erythritol 4-phosphate cytidylyltransferase
LKLNVMRCTVIIPAAGSGARFGADLPKQYLALRGRPVIAHTIERFLRESVVDRVIVCAAGEHLETVRALGLPRTEVVPGGASRRDSVRAGLEAAGDAELVAVHDSVRPFFRSTTFHALLAAAAEFGAAIPVLPVSETIHRVLEGAIVETPERSELFAAQTPQCFRLALLRDALDRAVREHYAATDEAGAAIRCGYAVRVIPGDVGNVKITQPDDLRAAEANFDSWSGE